jgi:hypothetical protein
MVSYISHNRLIHEKSPYLLQHATNPVEWYPWCDEAFERAGRENKPVFLSIGYSTCHWCHVMAHESFEDPDVAALMNRFFINIKVDREERPDIDTIYMTVCQMLTGSGGWPLTIIMSPEKKPFYAATYIPKTGRFGRAGMMEILPRLDEIWKTRRDELDRTAHHVVTSLNTLSQTPREEPTETILTATYDRLAQLFDDRNGGFGIAPKFPMPQHLLFLLRYWKRSGSADALAMVETTLQAMRRGGVYDHLGFGFHRYSVDNRWFLPHFEKMLYDQALLAYAYTETFQATGAPLYAETAQEIFAYVMRSMTSPDGGFYSAEDADSEGEEGKFYLWTWNEIKDILDRDEAALIADVFNVAPSGNMPAETTGMPAGENILHYAQSLADTAEERSIPVSELRALISSVRHKLFSAREGRIRPHMDDKILTDWNGLMIAALAKGGQVLHNQEYIDAAAAAAHFIMEHMRSDNGRLLHRFRAGEAGIKGQIDDYAFFLWGVIELYEATFDPRYLVVARELTTALMEDFWDFDTGGFFFSPRDGESLIARPKEVFEGAMPSGNAVALWGMLHLGRMTSDPELLDRAWDLARAFFHAVAQSPAAYTHFVSALDFAFGPTFEVVIVGDSDGNDTKEMLAALQSRFIPGKVVLFRPAGEASPPIAEIADYIGRLSSLEGKATAYVCTDNACGRPTTETGIMLTLLDP